MLDSLILNGPYEAPSRYWEIVDDGKEPHRIAEGRRKAGYMAANPKAKPHQDKGIFNELPLVNQIRPLVDKWRREDYPGVTGVTKTLLEHWHDSEQRDYPFFFCQIEAIETLIWLWESPEPVQAAIKICGDGGPFRRLCSKLATGTGKTVVMAMLIAWQSLNRITYPQNKRFSKDIFIVAPNLTVRERLAVLKPEHARNYYDEFGIVPLSLREQLRQANILIRNWHALSWESEEKIKTKKGVDKRGAKSDVAYVREVLGDMASANNLIVINDEAHHAWRVKAEMKITGVKREERDEATKWIGGLDRIHSTQGILNCFDFSATPFAPGGEEALFKWIVSDFGLNDAIESGLVKTPRIVVRDDALPDAKTYKSRLYHIYDDPEVKNDLQRKAEAHKPLPDLIINAYALLSSDWGKTREVWEGQETPPVMITVANRTETAARIKHTFDSKPNVIEPLLYEPDGILHIDSKVLKAAEEKEPESQGVNTDENTEGTERKATKKQQAEFLREKVNTVGQSGKAGAQVQNVISVGMLSEGWDARTVTHIMGLRAFTSQLLCEQVVGRGLRRASYEINEKGKFDAEYVNVFGVPFSFLPHVDEATNTQPPSPKTIIMPVAEKKGFAIQWPNIIGINYTAKFELSLDLQKVKPLEIDATTTVKIVEIAPTVDNKPDVTKIEDLDLKRLMQKFRKQRMVFEAARSVCLQMRPNWQTSLGLMMAQLVRLAEQFIDSDRIRIVPEFYEQDEKRRQLVIALNMTKVINHFWQEIIPNNIEKTDIIFDSNRPIGKTEDMRPWRTGKPCKPAKRSHINHAVFDSTWEESEAFELDRNEVVSAWVKNDHLSFEIFYMYKGSVKKYRPDFLIRLKSGNMLVLEVKGLQTEKDDAKHDYMREWIKAVNEHGGFGRWAFEVSTHPSDIKDILAKMKE